MLIGGEQAKLDVSLQCSGLGIVLTSSQLSDLSRMQVRLDFSYDRSINAITVVVSCNQELAASVIHYLYPYVYTRLVQQQC
jgi:hypothetical protein